MTTTRRTLLTALVAALAIAGCKDPVHDAEVDALGDEDPNVRRGPYHRPGQPCLVCHGGEGPGGDTFSIAGTIFQYPDSDAPLPNAVVSLIGSDGSTKELLTNCAGNFYAEDADYAPPWPLLVNVDYPGVGSPNNVEENMLTGIGRDGSCASCHPKAVGRASAGRVFMSEDHSIDFGNPGTCR